MKTTEVPPWRWGERFDPRVVRALVDAADAANDQALAFAEAHLLEQRADNTSERHSRETSIAGPRARAAAKGLGAAASEFTERIAKLYVLEALQFARLAADLLTRLHQGVTPADLVADDLPDLKPSHLYADPSLLPAPPITVDEQYSDDEEDSPSLMYAKILDILQIIQKDPTCPIHALDVDAPPDNIHSVWGTGGVELAQALHQYGHLCLWLLAGENPGTGSDI